MANMKKMVLLMIVSVIFFASSLAQAASFVSVWNPPDVQVDSSHPYYFPLGLPGWDLDSSAYTLATLDMDASTGIHLWAADPSTDTSQAGSYDIYLGTSTPTIDLLALPNFDALFDGQSTLYLVANLMSPPTPSPAASIAQDGLEQIHELKWFNEATLTLEAVPIPSAVWLLASGLIGLVGIRRGRK